ncbi:recombinase family protein [Paenibacillus cremeus]|uniref:Recombinase family protein n=1 Tax=Paenibacillus cremeus TaxID=2163881 RepID=A0A559JGL1_9BACL|nr:recombinase family protein [Paenibacillus cremeus]TVX99019.1 recombinase family protein [Paenibacillus cremeus]
MRKHVAMYLRISQEKEKGAKQKTEGMETLTNHRNILMEYAAKNNFTYEEFSEVLSGGKSELEERPQLQRLLDNIERFDAILVMELSRISRNGLISEMVLQCCTDYDKPIITPDKTYDLANNQTDVLTFRFGSLIASQEHALIGKRSKNNKISMAKQGLHISGGIPYGYRRNEKTKKLEICEEEAAVVRYIFQLHSEGLGSRKIVDKLNAEGYKPQRSNAFQLPTVKRIIQNPAYKGTVVFQDRKRIKENGKYTYKILNTIETSDSHPPIIPVEEWEQANRERVDRATKAKTIREKPAKTTGITMLKDLVFCGVCGRKMAMCKEKSCEGKEERFLLRPCYFQLPNRAEKCNNCGIKLAALEQEVVRGLRRHSKQLQVELRLLQQSDSTNVARSLKERLSNIDAQIIENQKQLNNLIDLAVAGIFSHEELKSKKQALLDHQGILEDSKQKILNQTITLNAASEIDRITHIINLLIKFNSPKLGVEEKNETLKQFVKKIHFTRVIPEEIRRLTTRNEVRQKYPFEVEMEFF